MSYEMKSAAIILVVVFLGAAVCDARFSETPIYKTQVTCPLAVAFGDLNGDQKEDMVIISSGKGWNFKENKLLIYYNENGAYPATPNKEIKLPSCFSLDIYDFDKDGKNDIVVVVSRKVYLLLNKNEFKPDDDLVFRNVNQGNGGVQVCKIFDEGTFDLLRGPVLRRFTLKKNGDYFVKAGYILGPDINDTWNTLAVDVNSDGKMDIVGTGRKDNTLRVYYGPILTFSVNPEKLSRFLQFKVPGSLSSFGVADLNGDDLEDLVVSDAKNGKTHIYHQNQPVGFDKSPKPSITINAGGRVYLKDVNGDKLSDLIIVHKNAKVVVFLRKKGCDFPTEISRADQVLNISRINELAFADVNGDGILDLLAKESYGKIRIYPGGAK